MPEIKYLNLPEIAGRVSDIRSAGQRRKLTRMQIEDVEAGRATTKTRKNIMAEFYDPPGTKSAVPGQDVSVNAMGGYDWQGASAALAAKGDIKGALETAKAGREAKRSAADLKIKLLQASAAEREQVMSNLNLLGRLSQEGISKYEQAKNGGRTHDQAIEDMDEWYDSAGEQLIKLGVSASDIPQKFDPVKARGAMALVNEAGAVDIAYKKAQTEKLRAETRGEITGAKATDIDDFVADAVAEAKRQGFELTPGERNKARLQFKRAQAEETRATKWAEKSVDLATVEKIKYNGELGKQLAIIATAADVSKAKGETTPVEKRETAQARMSGILANIANHYIKLDSMGAIVNIDNPSLSNVSARMRASTIGQAFENALGTNAQSIRRAINNAKPLIINYVRQASEMGARGLDSEKELEFYLQAATDEKADIQSNMSAIIVLDEAYGDGELGTLFERFIDPSLLQRLRQEGDVIRGDDLGETQIVPRGTIRRYNPATGRIE